MGDFIFCCGTANSDCCCCSASVSFSLSRKEFKIKPLSCWSLAGVITPAELAWTDWLTCELCVMISNDFCFLINSFFFRLRSVCSSSQSLLRFCHTRVLKSRSSGFSSILSTSSSSMSDKVSRSTWQGCWNCSIKASAWASSRSVLSGLPSVICYIDCSLLSSSAATSCSVSESPTVNLRWITAAFSCKIF